MFGIPWASIITGGVLLLGGMVVGGEGMAIYKNGVIAGMERDRAVEEKNRTAADLKQFTDISQQIATAAQAFLKTQLNLGTQFDTIQRDLTDARKRKPLPANCRPDAGRVRNLDAAIAAANSAAGF